MQSELDHAIDLRASGQVEEARDMLLALAAQHPENARVHYQAAWACDALGLEREAIPFYERALELGLQDIDLSGALLGLGSTYRSLGQYDQAVARLREGVGAFPNHRALQVFLAMALYNARDHQESMDLLLSIIADTSDDRTIQHYQRAIAYYAGKLDQIW